MQGTSDGVCRNSMPPASGEPTVPTPIDSWTALSEVVRPEHRDLDALYRTADAIVQSGEVPGAAEVSRGALSPESRARLHELASQTELALYRIVMGSSPILRQLTQGELAVLLLVGLASTPPTPVELSEKVALTRSRITQILDSLERRGYVVRVHDQEDRRRIRVALTEEGAAAFRGVRATMVALIENYLMLLGPDRAQELGEILAQTTEILDSYDLTSSSELLSL